MDAIMEELENFKERYPNEVPGLHGGEPLLLRDEDIETIFEWVYNNYEQVRNGEKYSHIQTNATLLRDKHIEMFDEYNVNVGISCDGPPELNEHRKAAMREEATDRLSGLTYENIFKLGETSVPVGVIVVVHEGNAGTDERLETLFEWMDKLNQNGISGHFNEMLPYEEINQELALSGERLKDVYLETWEWMKKEPYRTWNPMRDFQDNLLGNKLTDCRVAECDPFDAGAAKVIDGEGETSGCFDSETEILTTDGWKGFPKASVDDEVATINPNTQELEFHTPTEKQEYKWEGNMIHWKTKAMDCMVTPDHNMYTSTRNHEDWWKVEAEELADKSEPYFKKAPKSISSDETDIPSVEEILPQTKSNSSRNLTELHTSDIDRWLQFLGWYIAEGHCHGESYSVTITQDSQYTEEVVQLLNSLGPTVTQDGYEWTISSKQIYQLVEGLGLCDEKFVPEWIKNLPPEKIEVFLKSLFKGDGTSRNLNDSDLDSWIKYTTTSEQLANDVQELLLRIGKGGSISIQDKPTKGGKTRYDVSVVHHVDKTRVTAEAKEVDYSGMVYDFTVPPNHTLLVRRNGRTFVTGNCGKTWAAVGDGTPFLQGPSNNSEYNDDQDRERILKNLPGAPETEGPDLGGCKGCRYWKVCNGGCPSAGIDEDHRNRTRWCESKYYLYKRIEEDMRSMFPNIQLVTDLPWDAETHDLAHTGQLDIGQFDAMNSQGDGKKKSVHGGFERNKGLPENMVPQEAMPEKTQENIVDEFKRKHGEENVTVEIDGDKVITHADSDMGEE